MAKLSPFVVAEALENLVGFHYKAKKLHAGDLLVKVDTKEQSAEILQMTKIVDVNVSISPRRTLNTVRGVLSEDDLLESTDEEILQGVRPSEAVVVKRIMFRCNGKETPSEHGIVAYERRTLPTTVKAGYLFCRIKPYVENSHRCSRVEKLPRFRELCGSVAPKGISLMFASRPSNVSTALANTFSTHETALFRNRKENSDLESEGKHHLSGSQKAPFLFIKRSVLRHGVQGPCTTYGIEGHTGLA